MGERAHVRRWLPTLVLGLAGVAAALAGAEIAARRLAPRAAERVEYPCIYERDDRFGYRYRAGAIGRIAGSFEVRINSLGFHDEEPLPDGESELRVLAVGDSFTAALGSFLSQTWTAVLERALRAAGYPRADVVNLGIDGTGSDVHLELMRAYLPRFRPDVVVYAFFANDVRDVLDGRFHRECYRDYVLSYQNDLQGAILREQVDAHLERRLARWLWERSVLARLVLELLEGPRNPFRWQFLQPSAAVLDIDDHSRRARAPALRAAWRGIEELARRCDCLFVIVPVPPRGDLDGSLRVLRDTLRVSDLQVVDVVPAMRAILATEGRPETALHGRFDAHLSPNGNRIFGRAIAATLDWPQPHGAEPSGG